MTPRVDDERLASLKNMCERSKTAFGEYTLKDEITLYLLSDHEDMKKEIDRLNGELNLVQDVGADFVIETLAEALGVLTWTPCDGTETWEGDVTGTLYNILRDAKAIDSGTDEPAAITIAQLTAEKDEQFKAANALLIANDDLRARIAELEVALAKERELLTDTLAQLYASDPVNVATCCDEVIDRSGRLLGIVRDRAIAIRARAKTSGGA